MRLPANSFIAMEKLTEYLLTPRLRGDKSKFLALGGYDIGNAGRLLQDLRVQVLPRNATELEANAYGRMYEIRASLTGPSGRVLYVRTIWMTEFLSGRTKFITLIPDKDRSRS